MVLTRMPCSRSSMARVTASISSAAFAIVYGAVPGRVNCATMLEISTTSPRSCCAQVRDREPAEVVGREGVHAHHPGRLGRVGVGHVVAAAGDAGAVHEGVEPAVRGHDRLDHRGVLLGVLHGRRVKRRPATEGLDVGGRLLRGLVVAAVVDGHVEPVGRQGQAARPTDAATTAADQDHPAAAHRRAPIARVTMPSGSSSG